MTVLLVGFPNDPMIKLVLDELAESGADHVVWNPRNLENDCAFMVNDGKVEGCIFIGDRMIDMGTISGIFNRQSNVEITPEFRGLSSDNPLALHATLAEQRMSQYLDIAPCVVMNRAGANASNSSKPLQAMLIRSHFFVPNTWVGNTADSGEDFAKNHGDVIYKSCSGERSIVTVLKKGELTEKSATLRTCPVQVQQKVSGTDIRVHVVGDQVFATEIRAKGADYRYDKSAVWQETTVDENVAKACIDLTDKLGLVISGVDLRLADDDKMYCFEVNPSPAFSAYEQATGQRISRAIAMMLNRSNTA